MKNVIRMLWIPGRVVSFIIIVLRWVVPLLRLHELKNISLNAQKVALASLAHLKDPKRFCPPHAGDREKELLSMPEGHDFVHRAMDDQDGASDITDAVDVGELVKGEREAKVERDAERAEQRTLEDNPGDAPALEGRLAGEPDARTGTQRATIENNILGLAIKRIRQVLVRGKDVLIATCH